MGWTIKKVLQGKADAFQALWNESTIIYVDSDTLIPIKTTRNRKERFNFLVLLPERNCEIKMIIWVVDQETSNPLDSLKPDI